MAFTEGKTTTKRAANNKTRDIGAIKALIATQAIKHGLSAEAQS
ncbi:hypothetical protein [Acidiphilium sp. AL]|nr:hypothetical protein [Acidiphilium sp. AL]